MENKIKKSLIQTNIKIILLAVMGINQYVLIISLINKPFKTDLGKDAVYNFINSMIKESKYCSDVIKKYFNKGFAMTKEDTENFKNSTEC